MDNAIKIWEWDYAPEEYKALSEHGGDEDGIAFIPNGVVPPYWLERLWDGYVTPQKIEQPGGTLIIWAHA